MCGQRTSSSHYIESTKEKTKMANTEPKEYTKISVRKDLHDIVKKICDAKGTKMYHFEDEAVFEYIKKNYPDFLNGFKK
jgi:hypothetical protein